jgi:MurNAc alpha-1-phosphate uridylyltransferase
MSEIFPIAILAGGLATRLRPLTETIPKALVEINGEPFIAHQMRLLKNKGIKRIVMCAAYLGERIQDFVGDGSRFGMQVTYSFDGEKLLGTAGALKRALPLLGDSFFVLYGDSYLPCNYQQIQTAFTENNKLALMTIFRNEGRWDTSNVEYKEGNILTYDKQNRTDQMHYIDYGLGVFNQNAFANVSLKEPTDLAHLYQTLLKQKQLTAYEVKERFYEAGSFKGLEEMGEYLVESNYKYEENINDIYQTISQRSKRNHRKT